MFAIVASGCAVASDYHIRAGTTTGKSYSTVAGDIQVADGAGIRNAKTVAGDIDIDANVSTGDLSTVAGDITLGPAATVSGNVRTVAGDIEVGDHAHIAGEVATVAGDITLAACRVDGPVRIKAGTLQTSGTRLPGGIIVPRTDSDEKRTARITIGPGSDIAHITVEADRAVVLRISREATVGSVTGATPEYF